MIQQRSQWLMTIAMLALFSSACTSSEIAPVIENDAIVTESASTETPTLTPAAVVDLAEATATPDGLPDLSGESIPVYMIGDASSEYAQVISKPWIEGVLDMVGAINEGGGVFGATIEVHLVEPGGAIDEAMSAYETMTSEDPDIPLVFVFDAKTTEALAPRAFDDRIPILTAQPSYTALYGAEDGIVFSLAPLPEDQFAVFVDYITANWQAIRPEGAGDEIRLAYIGWPLSEREATNTQAALQYAQEQGVQVVAEETIDSSPVADTSMSIINVQVANANTLYLDLTAFGAANLLNDLHNLGIRDGFVIGGSSYVLDTYTYLADPLYAVGLYVPYPGAWWTDEDNEAIAVALENLENSGGERYEQSLARLLAQGSADLFRYALEQAILEVGLENLTGEAVAQALMEIEEYAVMGGLMSVSFTEGRRSPDRLQLRAMLGDGSNLYVVQDYVDVPELPR